MGGPPGSQRENPIIAMRHRMGLGQAEFARLIGCSLPSVWAAERGTTAKPAAIFRGLEQLGYDSARIASQYATWREEMLEVERSRLRRALESQEHE